MAKYEICAIGHVTNDVIADADGRRRQAIGGAAYYAGVALRRLGLRTLVVSCAAPHDIRRFAAAFAKCDVEFRCATSRRTTAFENRYDGADGRRVQRVDAVARPFRPSDIEDLDADCLHLGPLTAGEIPPGIVARLARRGGRISLDVQGCTRALSDGVVKIVDWPRKAEVLGFVDILKANRWEAAALAGTADPTIAARRLAGLGPAEVVVTCAEDGAVLCANGEIHEIPGAPIAAPRDPTGCGDSFCAGYLFARLRGAAAPDAARFGVTVAAAKLHRTGPFRGTAGDIDALLRS